MTAEQLGPHEKSGARRPRGPNRILHVPRMERQTAASRSRRGSSHGTSPSLTRTGRRPGHGPRGAGAGTYASMVGMAYFPVLVSMAPFMLGSFTSIIKLLGIPVLFLIRGPDSKFLSCRGGRERAEEPRSRLTTATRRCSACRTHGASCHPLDSSAGKDRCHPASRENRQRAGVTTRAQAHGAAERQGRDLKPGHWAPRLRSAASAHKEAVPTRSNDTADKG